MGRYEDLELCTLDEARAFLADEVGYAKKTEGTAVPVGLTSCSAVSLLLSELAEIAFHAPGGNQYLIEEAQRWAAVFGKQADINAR